MTEGLPAVLVAAANDKSRRLRELVRAAEILVMPGAHDVLSALLFERMGFKAIQCSSSGIAAVLGYPDGEVMGRDRCVQAIRRGNAYAESGADCIFYLNAHAREVIGRLVREVRAPVSVLAGPQTIGVRDLQDVGVARVSYGSAFTRMAIGAVRRLALEIQQHGTLASLADALPSKEFQSLVHGG